MREFRESLNGEGPHEEPTGLAAVAAVQPPVDQAPQPPQLTAGAQENALGAPESAGGGVGAEGGGAGDEGGGVGTESQLSA